MEPPRARRWRREVIRDSFFSFLVFFFFLFPATSPESVVVVVFVLMSRLIAWSRCCPATFNHRLVLLLPFSLSLSLLIGMKRRNLSIPISVRARFVCVCLHCIGIQWMMWCKKREERKKKYEDEDDDDDDEWNNEKTFSVFSSRLDIVLRVWVRSLLRGRKYFSVVPPSSFHSPPPSLITHFIHLTDRKSYACRN